MAGTTVLARTGWVASASHNSSGAGSLIDASGTSTRWSSNTGMTNGMWVQLDLGVARTFSRLTMDSGGSTNDYARGYSIYVSDNGTDWATQTAIKTGTGSGAVIDTSFTSVTKRYVRIVQTGSAGNWWSISDLNLYA